MAYLLLQDTKSHTTFCHQNYCRKMLTLAVAIVYRLLSVIGYQCMAVASWENTKQLWMTLLIIKLLDFPRLVDVK